MENAIWVNVSDEVSREAMGKLKFCLVGSWRTQPKPFPSTKKLEIGLGWLGN